MDRHLDWDGCFNARDLGGLRAGDGRRIRHGAIVRADRVDRLTAAGWRALEAHGVSTIVDLRNADEIEADAAPRPPGTETVHLPLDGIEDVEFWAQWASGPQFGTPLYYGPFLERLPDRAARAVAAVARARPGGVLVHCAGGRDRTGLVTALVLALAGVAPEDVAADYALSEARLTARCAATGAEDDGPVLAAFLAARGTSAPAVLADLLRSLDVEALVLEAGVAETDLAALRERLLDRPEAGA